MKILHIAHGAPGGIGRVEKLLAAVWEREKDLEVTTICRSKSPSRLGEGRVGPKNTGRLRWALTVLLACLRTNAHVVILNHLNLAPFAFIIRRFHPKTRVVVWAYGVEAWRHPDISRRFGLRFIDQVWSISEHTAREFSHVAAFPRDRIVVVPLALAPERASTLGQQPHPNVHRGPQPEILAVSRLWKNEAKGIDQLIEALVETTPDVRLTIVGDGEDRPRLEWIAEAAGVRPRVTFTGLIDDAALTELYRRCAIFALPSTREGFGLVFLEAMTAGKPVVGARAAAVPELVSDGETGLLVPRAEPKLLADAISSLVANPSWAATLGERGRLRAELEFGFNRFADRVLGLLA